MLVQKHTERIQKIYSKSRIKFPRLRAKNNRKKIDEKKLKIVKVFTIFLIGIIIARSIVNSINPIINLQCINEAKNIAIVISNEQATKIMEKFQYEDLTEIVKDESGKIQMIKLNIIPVNEIISEVSVNIQNEFNNKENTQISLRIGSFFGVKLLSEVGPKINIKLSTSGNVETNLKSEFKTAGINQTLHQIYLEIKCQIIILTPYDTVSEDIVNYVLIAESIIVGEIPSSYYNLNDSSTLRNNE